MKGALVLVLIAMVVLAAACVASSATITIDTAQGPVTVTAETADESAERARGLMERASLDENAGMLFVFDGDAPRSFWMKNTLIPLDMLFIDSQGRIVDMTTMQPCRTVLCESYTSQPARYVLEVNAGFAEKHGVAVGDVVTVDR